jgi:hypothetical protein
MTELEKARMQGVQKKKTDPLGRAAMRGAMG